MKIIKENMFLFPSFLFTLLFSISISFASSPPSSEIGDWVLENSSYTINAATVTVHGDVYVKTTSTISIETGGNLKIGRFWTKRIPITISTSVSPDIPDDYQIWVPTTAFTTVQWSDIKGGTGQADLDDVRFVSSMNATGYWESCPYWIDPDTNNPKGFWVKISSINQANSNVYMYYGNDSAIGESNAKKTYELFDEFNSFDSTYWDIVDCQYSVSGGILILNIPFLNALESGLSSKNTFSGKSITETKLAFIGDTNNAAFGLSKYNTGMIRTSSYIMYHWQNNLQAFIVYKEDGSENQRDYVTQTESYITYKFINDGVNIEHFYNGTSQGTLTTLSQMNSEMYFRVVGYISGSYDGPINIDYVKIRKYAEGEPTISAGATEATPPTGYHIYVYPKGQIYQQQGSGINK